MISRTPNRTPEKRKETDKRIGEKRKARNQLRKLETPVLAWGQSKAAK